MKKIIAMTILGAILASCYHPPQQAWQPKRSFSVDHTRKKHDRR
ncbi:hypothetical protein QNI19_04805 [Cytophagaceae bacterium DM2B3-1]|uniref:Quinol oxidase subunit 4 n=1 Tax=Xanthocytophaga flava TaxID=3048013 RepID=A0ABT7CET1_9BACT|nr:hypothetical protein [Xanthocytophaga flavus]MDJ1469064.1 hypothetical protein [Xanthocytophaga flavus]MDJ1492239.1 hypothetical protein [Xanthocytophaga flavus]